MLDARNLRIAVLGAGPAGLTAAQSLIRAGSRQLTVFDAGAEVGGQVQSVAVGHGVIWEAGAMIPLTADLFAMGRRYGLTVALHKPFATGRELDTGRTTGRWGPPLGDVVKLVRSLRQLKTALRQPTMAGARPELCLPLARWLGQVGLSEAGRTFVLGNMAATSESLAEDDIPTWNFLRVLSSVSTRRAILRRYYFREGFQELWRRVAAELEPARWKLNCRVTSVSRGRSGVEVRYKDGGGEMRETFDAAFVAFPATHVPAILDASADERALFQRVRSQDFAKTWHRVTGWGPRPRWHFITPNALSRRYVGRPVGFYTACFHDRPARRAHEQAGEVYVFYHFTDGHDDEALVRAATEDVARLGGRVTETLRVARWTDHNLHFSCADVAENIYGRIEALQGVGRCFFVGEGIAGRSVGQAVAHARFVVDSHFAAQEA